MIETRKNCVDSLWMITNNILENNIQEIIHVINVIKQLTKFFNYVIKVSNKLKEIKIMIKESYEEIIELERQRQNHNVELIASENFPSKRVLDAAGSILTNKDRKSTRLNSSHPTTSRMPSSA